MLKIGPVVSGILLGCLLLPCIASASKPGYPVRLAWAVDNAFVSGTPGHATLVISTALPIAHLRVEPASAETRELILGSIPEYEGPLTPEEPLLLPVSFVVSDGRSLTFQVLVDGPRGSYRLGASLDVSPEASRPTLRAGAPTVTGESTLEAGVSGGSPLHGPKTFSAAGDSVRMRGRFLYRDRVMSPSGFVNALPEEDPVRPIRFASIELIVVGQSLPIATGLTDSLGVFSISIVPEPQLTYRVRVLSTTGLWGGSTFRVRSSSGSGGSYYSGTTPNQAGVAGDVDWGDMVVEPGAAEAFNLLDCSIESARQIELLTGSLPSANLNVYWNPSSTNGTYFTPNQSAIYLLADEGFDDCVLIHEFGHFVAAHYSNDDSPGGQHFIDDDQQDVRLAWSEGFASYFQSSVRKRLGDPFASWYIDTWGTPGAGQLLFSYDLESASLSGSGTSDNRSVFQGLYLRGAGSEVVVQALLWDIEDDAAVPGDGTPGVDDDPLALGNEPWWQVISGPLLVSDAVSLEDFWDGWFDLALDHQADMEATFGALGAEFFPDASEDDDTEPEATPLPTSGVPVHHTFYPLSDVDVHSVNLEASIPVLVETSNILSYGDTYLEITNGDSVWSNENRSPGELSSAVHFVPPVTGEYMVRVLRSETNFQSQMTTYGSYDVRIVVGAPEEVLYTAVSAPSAPADPGFTIGVAIADADLDGLPDIYVVNNSGCGTVKGKDAFYHNEGALAFTNETQAAGFVASEGGIGAAWGDFDRDGDPDLFVTDHGLYENDGSGVFTDMTVSAGVSDIGREYDASWVDTDGDGWLDLFVLRRDGPSVLWRNERNGTFEDVTAATGLTFPPDGGAANGCAWGDYDADGRPDLFISRRSSSAQVLYRNLGGNQFEDVTLSAGLVSEMPASGGVWGDVSGDGRLDLYVTSTGPDRLYIQNGDGTFTDRAREYGVDLAPSNNGAGLFDADLDGDLDLYASTYDGGQYLFRNLGSTMVRLLEPSDLGLGYGMAAGDLDGDGDPELYQGLGCTAGVCLCQNNLLYENEAMGRHWLGVKLVGDVSNMDGVGARVLLHAGSSVQTREMGTGSGWASKSLLPLMFGLGESGSVDSVEVFWPSGGRNLVTGIEIDRVITVIEDTRVPVAPPGPEIPFRMALRGPSPNPFRSGTTLIVELTHDARVEAVIYDVSGRRVRTLVDRELAAGTQFLGWDGIDDKGRRAGSGLYFYRVQAGGLTEIRKLLIVSE